jgi:hypothetical protein
MIKKPQKITEQNKGFNLQNNLQLLKDFQQDFIFESSTYTSKIITANSEINFITNEMNLTAFIANAKIKKDIANSKIRKPIISPLELDYFEQNLRYEQLDYVINFDLTKAYPTILYNSGFITLETFDYLCSIDKKERLASIGMLARKKNIVEYKNGKPVVGSLKIDRKDTSEYFYHCIKTTNDIITEIKKAVKNRFLFTWVDGIYFEMDTNENLNIAINETQKICDKYKMKFTFEILTNYVCDFQNGLYTMYFNKGENIKRFCIPSEDLNLNYKSYLKANSKIK